MTQLSAELFVAVRPGKSWLCQSNFACMWTRTRIATQHCRRSQHCIMFKIFDPFFCRLLTHKSSGPDAVAPSITPFVSGASPRFLQHLLRLDIFSPDCHHFQIVELSHQTCIRRDSVLSVHKLSTCCLRFLPKEAH